MTQSQPSLTLPPPFRAFAVAGEVWPAALSAAAAGGEPGTVLWSDDRRRCQAAVILQPDGPLAASAASALRLTALAAVDALLAVGPPNVPVTIAPPDRIEIDEGLAGGVRIAAPPGTDAAAVPDWLLVGIDLAWLGADPEAPGRDPWRTALCEEGFGDVTAVDLIESFCRHLRHRISGWEEAGDAAIEAAWREHTTSGVAGRNLSAARRARAANEAPVDPAACLAGPSWAGLLE
jgi:biotin-(acetyl-CoA carboxylase) ligase